jgi:CubicO group peptidase (beta-lactamase class C family)
VKFSGVVLLAGSDGPIFRKAYGLASKEYEVPNSVDTRFNLGSINKFFTRIAIEQLVARGAVSMDDTIGKFLPDYPNKEAAAKVTVRHLLDMSSGIGNSGTTRARPGPDKGPTDICIVCLRTSAFVLELRTRTERGLRGVGPDRGKSERTRLLRLRPRAHL